MVVRKSPRTVARLESPRLFPVRYVDTRPIHSSGRHPITNSSRFDNRDPGVHNSHITAATSIWLLPNELEIYRDAQNRPRAAYDPSSCEMP